MDAVQLVGCDGQQNHVEEKITHILKKKGGPLEAVKEELREARKPKMRKVEHFLCDKCDTTITDPKEGFIIHGNIYMADPTANRGLIGNNFPEKIEGLATEEIKKTVLCRKCFYEVLVFSPPKTKSTPGGMHLKIGWESNDGDVARGWVGRHGGLSHVEAEETLSQVEEIPF